MKTRPVLFVVMVAFVFLVVLPLAAHAQSAFTGVVKDPTGAVLPGVEVKASSNVLIEKERLVVTDERGSYRIVDLRPGTYALEFSLPGFGVVKREVELQSNFTAAVNVEMAVGTIANTVEITTETPVVDTQTTMKAQVLPRDVLDMVPNAHTIQSVGQLIVGVTLTAPDVGGSQAMQQTYFTVHGAGAAQTSVLMDGMIINGLQGDGAIQSYQNDAGNQEMVYQTGGGVADTPTGGLRINLAPKEGGNQFHGSAFVGYESTSLQSDNLTSFLKTHGVGAVDKIGLYRDLNFTQGGPIKKDKLWFFSSARFFTVNKPISNSFYVPAGQTYTACKTLAVACTQGVDGQTINSVLLRLTWQMTPRNKLSASADRLFKTRNRAMNPGDDPATASVVWNSPLYMVSTLKWTSTMSSRLLIQAGYSSNLERYNNLYQPGIEQPYGSPAWYAGAHHGDAVLGTTSNAALAEYGSYPDRHNIQASVSYVKGPHDLKFGFQNSWGVYNQTLRANADLYQNYLAGVPSTVTVLGTPARWQDRLNSNFGMYAQDAWHLRRLTLTYALRWEYISEQATGQPAQHGRFANILAYGDFHPPTWKDFSPRVGVAYDVAGNGKTVIRAGFSRFMAAATTTFASLYDPGNALLISATVPWTPSKLDPTPDVAHGELGCAYLPPPNTTPDCEINLATLPKNFGVISLAQPDPGLKRPYAYGFNLGMTREVVRGLALSAEWFHNDGKNLVVRNNILRPGTYSAGSVTNPNYRPVNVFSPLDGTTITMYDTVSSAVNSAVANVDSTDPNIRQTYNAFEFNFNARLAHGITFFGGTATERTIANVCSAAVTNPNILLYCDQSKSGIPWRTQFKVSGTYPLPRWGIQVSGSFQALPGYILGTQALTQGGAGAPNLTAVNGAGTTFTVTPATKYTVCPGSSAQNGCVVGNLVIPGMTMASLGVPLVAPGTELTPRLSQIDLSFAKRISFERLKISPKVDIFNMLNSSDYFTVQSLTYQSAAAAAAAYKQPGSILQGRIIRLGAVVNW
jgi:hypothetical protein